METKTTKICKKEVEEMSENELIRRILTDCDCTPLTTMQVAIKYGMSYEDIMAIREIDARGGFAHIWAETAKFK